MAPPSDSHGMTAPRVEPDRAGDREARPEFVVPPALAGERLDRVVAMLAEVSRRHAAALVTGEQVSIDGVCTTRVAHRVAEGDVVAMPVPEPEPTLRPAPEIALDIVHIDDAVIVVNKPADLVVHPASGTKEPTLIEALLARFPDIGDAGGDPQRPGVVHRLDRGTSGLIMVARTDAAREDLSEQLRQRSVHRSYLALVWGAVEGAGGLIDAPLGRSPRDATRRAVVADGKSARTRFEVLHRIDEPDMTLLRCQLETGRTHQIRAHLEAIGHPVLGDQRYGPSRDTVGLSRPFLHAQALGFMHPELDEYLQFWAPVPEDLAELARRLGIPAAAMNDGGEFGTGPTS